MSNETVTYSLESVLTRIESKIDSLEKRMDEKIDSLEKRMDERFDKVNRGINGTGWLSGIYQPGDSDSFGGCCLGRCC